MYTYIISHPRRCMQISFICYENICCIHDLYVNANTLRIVYEWALTLQVTNVTPVLMHGSNDCIKLFDDKTLIL